jgi:uncharacterized protein (TIGR00369 family)
VTRSLTQSAGVAHGGVAASLIDSAVGLALCTLIEPEQLITTVEMKLNYLSPVPLGTLKARGKIIHRGKRIAVGEAEARVRKTLVAKGLVTYAILDRKITNTVLWSVPNYVREACSRSEESALRKYSVLPQSPVAEIESSVPCILEEYMDK